MLDRIDTLIEKFKRDHKGEAPLYIILSGDENKRVMNAIKAAENLPEHQIVTTYRGVKLAEHPHQSDGEVYVSNELPETGS